MTITDSQFAANVIIQLLEDDHTKIIDCLEDAERMIAADADMGAPKVDLMGEAAIYIFKEVNKGTVPELITVIDNHYEEVIDPIIRYFISKGY